MGSLLLGFIAAIGAYRFGFSQIEELAELHGNASRLGGGVAIILIGAQFLLLIPGMRKKQQAARMVLLTVAACILAMLFVPNVGVGLIGIWMLVPIVVTAVAPSDSAIKRMLLIGLASIFLINFLLVRQSGTLGPVYSWHLYHILIATWLIAIVFLLKRLSEDSTVK